MIEWDKSARLHATEVVWSYCTSIAPRFAMPYVQVAVIPPLPIVPDDANIPALRVVHAAYVHVRILSNRRYDVHTMIRELTESIEQARKKYETEDR